jgi:hypothetical protein
MSRWSAVAAVGLLALAGAGCELTEVDVAEAEPVVVVEGLVRLSDRPGGDRDEVVVYLHRSFGPGGVAEAVPGARVEVIREGDGARWRLEEQDASTCLVSAPVDAVGTCYGLPEDRFTELEPGDELTLEVDTPGGASLLGRTTVPPAFTLRNAPTWRECWIPAGEPFELVWSRSPGAWSYVTEATLVGLREALEPRGIPVEEEPLELLGVALSADDTTSVVPGDLGVFDRADLDRQLALVLQEGMPPATRAVLALQAADRNTVNWLRGGNFNPSGQIRVPSIAGDGGTGFFGAVYLVDLEIFVEPLIPEDTPACGTP